MAEYQEYPKWISAGGKNILVNNRDEESRATGEPSARRRGRPPLHRDDERPDDE